MIMAMNPFIYETPVAPADLVDREGEIALLSSRAESGHNSRLSAPRRYGKTSLLQKVIEDVRAMDLPVVYVNFFGVVTIDDIARRIDRAYHRQLEGPIRNLIIGILKTVRPTLKVPGLDVGVATAPGAEAAALLETMLDLPLRIFKKTGQRTLVVFDEFQDVLTAELNADALIRSRIEFHRDEASYIFAGSHISLMSELFDKKERPLFGQARAVKLPPLPNEELAEYLEHQFTSTNRVLSGEVLNALLTLVRGHPQRSMLVAHHLWEQTIDDKVADELAWQRALHTTYLDIEDSLETFWSGLDENERRVLTAIAEAPTTFLSKQVLEKHAIPRTTAQRIRDRFIGSGDLEARGKSTVVVDPLLAAWLVNDRQGLVEVS